MRTDLLVLLVAVSLGGTTGCDFLEKFAEKAKEEAETQEQDSADDTLGQKLNKYILCINTTSASVGRASDHYHRWIVDPDKGPTGSERNVFGTLEIINIDACKDNIKAAKKMKPELEKLEKRAEAWLEKLEAVDALNGKAYKYYKAANYKDDAFKQGKELHPKLHKAFEAFFEEDKKFRAAFSDEKKELDERELERLEREGQKLAYAHKKFMLVASDLVEMGKDAELPDMKNLDAGKYGKLLEKAEKAHAAMEKAATGAEKKKVSSWSPFESAATDFMRAAKDLHRRKRDNKPFTPQEMQQLARPFSKVEGSPQVLLDTFNDMVNKSNMLTWR